MLAATAKCLGFELHLEQLPVIGVEPSESLDELLAPGLASGHEEHSREDAVTLLLEAGRIGFHGVERDRQLAFQVLDDTSGLPWVSGRSVPWIGGLEPVLANDELMGANTSTGDFIDVDELLARISASLGNAPVRVTRLWRGTFDSMPLSIVTTRNVSELASESNEAVPVTQLRSNLVLDTVKGDKSLVGLRLRLGAHENAPRVGVARHTQRCTVMATNSDGVVDRDLYRTVQSKFRNKVGVYATIVRAGTVAVGDAVFRS